MEKHSLHIKNPELQTSSEVERAVKRKERHTGEKIPNNPRERIEAYMGRLGNIFLNPDKRKHERNMEMFRDKIYDALIIKPEQVPESYFELQKRAARERGQTVEEIPQNIRDQMIETVIADQKHSLDQWVDYLTSDDVAYPAWFKYFVWRNVIKLSQFDKTLGKFKTRTESTVAPYPDIYRAPLAKILDIYERAVEDKTKLKDPTVQADFSKRFSKLYAELISESLAVKIESREQIGGKWVKYDKGNQEEADKLFDSVQAKGTGWCIEGQTTARNYIKQGDFYVYYTYDKDNNPIQPRIAIQMNGSQIGQIRGIQEHQELEPIMSEVLEDKLEEFGPEADSYKKKNADMKKMTEIEKKTKSDKILAKDDLTFLYEIDSPIKGFGYEKDPRIAELKKNRNPEEDILVIFDCAREQIAHTSRDINENTKVFVGKLEPGIFDAIQQYNIEHVYTSFPEGEIRKETITIGGKTWQELEKEMRARNIKIGDYALDMMKSKEFKTLEQAEVGDYVRLKVDSLGLQGTPTTDQIYARANELGLDLCPTEVGPHYRLQYMNQPLGEYFCIAMKQIAARDGYPYVFSVYRGVDGLWLSYDWAEPAYQWRQGNGFVFRLRKKNLKS
ncbi:MAG: hypothetical protein CEN90_583 [Parcubacteria group bacterium Licking1014_17]|nr:MAG: hypothetical protein CEN90_583 [Parcubacteria group bacterium Licking1014_17]